MRSAALAVYAFSAAAAAAGTASIQNNCELEVYLWAAGNREASPLGRFAQGQGFSGALEEGLNELKITIEEDALDAGGVLTSLAYRLDGDTVSYDVYNIFESPYSSLIVEAEGGEGDCGSIEWPEGEPIPGNNAKGCSSDADITLTLCP